MNAEHLFQEALKLVESSSIRSWATTEHNRPIFVQLADKVVAKNGPTSNPTNFATYIVATAIGL